MNRKVQKITGSVLSMIMAALLINVFLPAQVFGQAQDCANNIFSLRSDTDTKADYGDDFNLTNASYTTQIEDFSVLAKGIPVKFERHYNSRCEYLGVLGKRWIHSFEMKIERTNSGAFVTMQDGSVEQYVWDGRSQNNIMTFVPGPMKGFVGELRYYNNIDGNYEKRNTWVLKYRNKMSYYFAVRRDVYSLEKIQDRNGNEIRMIYDSNNVLSSVGVVIANHYDVQTVLSFEYYPEPDANTPAEQRTWGGLLSSAKLYQNDGTTVAREISYRYKEDENFDPQVLSEVRYPKYTANIDTNDKAVYLYSNDTGRKLNHYEDVRAPKGYTKMDIIYNNTGLGKVSAIKAPHGTGGTMITVGYISNWQIYSRTYTEARGYSTIVTTDDNYNVTSETDALGNVTSYGYDSKLNTIAVTNAGGYVTSYSYDDLSNTTSVTNAMGDVTNYEYEYQGDADYGQVFAYLKKTIAPTGTGTERITTQNFYETGTGNLTMTRDALGHETRYAYNSYGQIVTVTDALGYKTVYSYVESGNAQRNLFSVRKQVSGSTNDTLTDSNSTYVEYAYDELNRVVTTKELVETGKYRTTKNAYENSLKGERITKTELLDGTGTTVLTVARYEYDVNGNRVKITDANNKETNYVYDSADRLLEVATPFGTSTARITTKYEYDCQNNRTKLIDARGKETAYTYDQVNRLSTVTDATSHQTSYTYDQLGKIHTKTDGKSQTTTYAYDSFGRLTGDGTQGYTYDNSGNRLIMSKDGGNTNYQYDALNRLTRTETPDGSITAYTYNSVGNRLTMKIKGIGDGDSASYAYNGAGWLTSVTDQCGGVTNYTDDKAGNRKQVSYSNGVVTNYTYTDDIYRLASLVSTNSSGVTLAFQNYTSYDAVGNILTRADDNGTTTYQYDNLYQLKHVAYPDTKTTDYNYDEAGNRTRVVETGSTVVTTDYTCNDANELTQFGSTTLEYDNNGNQTRKGDKYYNWNIRNQLTSVTGFANNISYEYDGDGRRTKKIVGTAETRYYYDGANCVAETDDTGTVKAVYTHGIELISKKDSTGVLYFLYDHLGNTMATVNSSGTVVTRYEYDAFGAVRSQTPSNDTRNKNKFVGGHGIVDDSGDNGLIYMRARYYDPEIGRFISRDPYTWGPDDERLLEVSGDSILYESRKLYIFYEATNPLLSNRYIYCLNNPVNIIDIDGKMPEWLRLLGRWLKEFIMGFMFHTLPEGTREVLDPENAKNAIKIKEGLDKNHKDMEDSKKWIKDQQKKKK